MLLFSWVLLSTSSTYGQGSSDTNLKPRSSKKHHREQWEAGMMGGVSAYNGDLSTGNLQPGSYGGGGGLFVRYRFNDVLSGRGNLQFGNLRGADRNFEDLGRRVRNFSFTASFYDFGLLAEFEPFGKIKTVRKARSGHFLSPYIHFGISGVLSVPLVDFNEPNIVAKTSDINLDRNNSSFFHAAIPFGAGLRYDLNKNWMVGAEAGIRRVFTDYLDGISKAGNPEKKDWIGTANLVLGYRFAAFRDKDGDGIPNNLDACPLEAGTKKTKGCPDRDLDGIADKTDRCPDAAGTAVTMGCPDADGDGIEDSADECPGEVGAVTQKGCPDTDGDGIADRFDKCPGLKGSEINSGCPDTTVITAVENKMADSLFRAKANAPDKPINVTGNDSPNNENAISFVLESFAAQQAGEKLLSDAETLKILKEAEEGILFDRNRAQLKDESGLHLNRILLLMREHSDLRLRIIGHSEKTGVELQNVVLSVARARAVYDYLLREGIDFRRLVIVGSGSARTTSRVETPPPGVKKKSTKRN